MAGSYHAGLLFATSTRHVISPSRAVSSRTTRPWRSNPNTRNRAAWRATAPLLSLKPPRACGKMPGTSGPKKKLSRLFPTRAIPTAGWIATRVIRRSSDDPQPTTPPAANNPPAAALALRNSALVIIRRPSTTRTAYAVHRTGDKRRHNDCRRDVIAYCQPAGVAFWVCRVPECAGYPPGQSCPTAPFPTEEQPGRHGRLRRHRATSVDDPARPHLSRGEVAAGPLATRLGQLGSTALLLLARSHLRSRRHGADDWNGDQAVASVSSAGRMVGH